MSERVVFPPEWWIRAYLAGNASVLFVPMKPQPIGFTNSGTPYYDSIHDALIANQFTPGDTLLCKERIVRKQAPDYEWDYATYAADLTAVIGDEYTPKMLYRAIWRWGGNSIGPASMPRDVVRVKPTVQSVSAVWMPDVDEDDALAAGISGYTINDGRWEDERLNLEAAWVERYGSWDVWAWRVEVQREPA